MIGWFRREVKGNHLSEVMDIDDDDGDDDEKEEEIRGREGMEGGYESESYMEEGKRSNEECDREEEERKEKEEEED